MSTGRIFQVSTTIASGVTTTLASSFAYRPTLRTDGVYAENITAYDGADNILTRSAPGAQGFTYDALNRLYTATDNNTGAFGTLGYAYDPNGNRASETRNGTTMSYVYSPSGSNWLSQTGSEYRLANPDGSTASTTSLGPLSYDGYGDLTGAGVAGAAYAYDPFGRRNWKSAGGTTTAFAYGPHGELLYETGGTNTKAYVYLNGVPFARIDNNSQIYYYHNDHLGTPQAMTDSTGTTVWKASYEPFGKATVTTQTVTNNLRMLGMYADETGLYYWGARSYDPRIGRGISADGMSVVEHVQRWQANMGVPGQPPLELNLYVAMANNPLRWIDRTGFNADPPPMPTEPPSFEPNGNYVAGFERQDMICTLPGFIGTSANSNSCVLSCCQAHDACYAKYGCNQSSWIGNAAGQSKECQQCNSEVKSCVARAITKGCSSCSKQ